MEHLSTESIKSFAIDIRILLEETRRALLKSVGFSTTYRFRNNLFTLSHQEKALIFDKIIAK
jgi:hypothetical protein